MVFNDHAYSVLVVSAAGKFNDTLTAMLPEVDCDPARYVTSIAAAKRAVLEQSYDFVIINAPLLDDFGVKFAIDACASRGTVVLLLVRTEVYEEIRLVNRAKWLLIEHQEMNESDAHRYIEKQAMDRCVTRRTIAEGVIKAYT